MARPRREEKLIPIDNLLIIADTEKAVGVIKIGDIVSSMNPQAVTKTNEIEQKIKMHLQWIPKSQLKEVKVQDANDVFPNLTMTKTSRFSDKITPYKTKISCIMPDWIAKQKNFIADDGADGGDEGTGSIPKQQSESPAPW